MVKGGRWLGCVRAGERMGEAGVGGGGDVEVVRGSPARTQH